MHTFSLSIQDWRLGRSARGLELRLQGGRHRRVGLANDWSLEVVGVVEEIRNRFVLSFAEAMNQQKASRGETEHRNTFKCGNVTLYVTRPHLFIFPLFESAAIPSVPCGPTEAILRVNKYAKRSARPSCPRPPSWWSTRISVVALSLQAAVTVR